MPATNDNDADYLPSTANEQLILDLYTAERLAEAPGGLSLRKVWVPFSPSWHCRRSARGYYVVYTHRRRVCYHYLGLTERARAHALFDALAQRIHSR